MRTLLLSFTLALVGCSNCSCGHVIPSTHEPMVDASTSSDAISDAGLPTCASVGCPSSMPLNCTIQGHCFCPQPDAEQIECTR